MTSTTVMLRSLMASLIDGYIARRIASGIVRARGRHHAFQHRLRRLAKPKILEHRRQRLNGALPQIKSRVSSARCQAAIGLEVALQHEKSSISSPLSSEGLKELSYLRIEPKPEQMRSEPATR